MAPQLPLARELRMGETAWVGLGWVAVKNDKYFCIRDISVGVIILCASPLQNKNERCRKIWKSKQTIRK